MRVVLADCHSEQVRALVEEHNVMVEALQALSEKRRPTRLPQKITVKEVTKG
jgi:hemerythrin-like domain-containing protein